jgi:hypothetical protein
MITGIVNANREAIISLVVRDASGQTQDVSVIMDTCTLPLGIRGGFFACFEE